jgi:hypothetical protein
MLELNGFAILQYQQIPATSNHRHACKGIHQIFHAVTTYTWSWSEYIYLYTVCVRDLNV